jgi:hypothetical protein
MRSYFTALASLAAIVTHPSLASAQGATAFGVGVGAVTGAAVGGPPGAVVGGVIDAVAEHSMGQPSILRFPSLSSALYRRVKSDSAGQRRLLHRQKRNPIDTNCCTSAAMPTPSLATGTWKWRFGAVVGCLFHCQSGAATSQTFAASLLMKTAIT